jgi:hypothetical protein
MNEKFQFFSTSNKKIEILIIYLFTVSFKQKNIFRIKTY